MCFLIEEDLRHGFNRFTHGFFQIGFSDAFRVDIHITEVEIITLFSQFLCQFFRAHTVRASLDDQKLLQTFLSPQKTSLTANSTYSAR